MLKSHNGVFCAGKTNKERIPWTKVEWFAGYSKWKKANYKNVYYLLFKKEG